MKFIFLALLVACATKAPKPQIIFVPTLEVAPPAAEVTPAAVQSPDRTVLTAKSKLTWPHEVARVANCVINTEAFIQEVAAFPKYTYTDKTPAQVAQALREVSPVVIRTYATKNPFSTVTATTYVSDPGTVYFNTRRNPRAMKPMVNTAIHEGLHPEFGHGDNSPVGKEDSVNYRVGSIAEKYVEACL